MCLQWIHVHYFVDSHIQRRQALYGLHPKGRDSALEIHTRVRVCVCKYLIASEKIVFRHLLFVPYPVGLVSFEIVHN